MPAPCQPAPSIDAFASDFLAFIDCESRGLGADGYRALTTSGSSVQILIGGVLTVFVALWGYRLTLGEAPSVRDAVMAVVKIGIVLTLAGNWPSYQTLVYDVTLRAPVQLAAEIGAPRSLPGSGGDFVDRLNGVENGFRQLEILGPGEPDPDPGATIRQNVPPPLFANFDRFALGAARLVYLEGALGSFTIARLAAGLLLALGPLFAAFLLFDATRGLFDGWVRALIGMVLAMLAAQIVIGVELALFEPWLLQSLAIRQSGASIPGVPGQMLAVALIFLGALAGTMLVLVRTAMTYAVPAAGHPANPLSRVLANLAPERAAIGDRRTAPPVEPPSRAVVVADAIARAQRREARDWSPSSRAAVLSARGVDAGSPGAEPQHFPAGPSYRRGAAIRVSAAARHRERRT